MRPNGRPGWAVRRRRPAVMVRAWGLRQSPRLVRCMASGCAGELHRPGRGAARGGRAAGYRLFIIMDNLSANKTPAIRSWARRENVELCFTPTSAS
jgi:hypothetical protein